MRHVLGVDCAPLTTALPGPDIDVSDCHPLFRDSFRGFYSPDAAVVDGSVDTALTTVQAAKERRPLACQGNGLKHMMKVLREAPDGSPAQLTAVRLCAEAGLHDDTEVRARTGGVHRFCAISLSLQMFDSSFVGRTYSLGQAPWRRQCASHAPYVESPPPVNVTLGVASLTVPIFLLGADNQRKHTPARDAVLLQHVVVRSNPPPCHPVHAWWSCCTRLVVSPQYPRQPGGVLRQGRAGLRAPNLDRVLHARHAPRGPNGAH